MNLADLFSTDNIEDRRAEYPRMPQPSNRMTLDQIQSFWANPQTMIPGAWRLDRLNRGYNALRQMPYAGPPLSDYDSDIERAMMRAKIEAAGSRPTGKTFLRTQ